MCFDFVGTPSHHSMPYWNIFGEGELNFPYQSCVKKQFVQICESGVRNCPWWVRPMSLVCDRETHAWCVRVSRYNPAKCKPVYRRPLPSLNRMFYWGEGERCILPAHSISESNINNINWFKIILYSSNFNKVYDYCGSCSFFNKR